MQRFPIYRARPRAKTHLEPEIGIYEESLIQKITGQRAFQNALKRVDFSNGRYRYNPSEEYRVYLSSLHFVRIRQF